MSKENSRNYLIGAGGWGYFRVPRVNSLVAYSKVFSFVEVNATFYEIPDIRAVKGWRELVPLDFEFAVRANRAITHKYRFQPVDEAVEILEKMIEISRVLNANILHLQTPPSLQLNDGTAENLCQLVSSARLGDLRLAVEFRQFEGKLPPKLMNVMQENRMIHCVDLSKGQTPAYGSDVLYTRLFGTGEHNIYQPTDEELAQIDEKASASKAERVMMSFHFVRMYKDAARLKVYKQTGKFPMVTRSTGLNSLVEIMREDAVFPATREELITRQGWKVFDETETRRIHAAEYLGYLPEGKYKNLGQVKAELSSILR